SATTWSGYRSTLNVPTAGAQLLHFYSDAVLGYNQSAYLIGIRPDNTIKILVPYGVMPAPIWIDIREFNRVSFSFAFSPNGIIQLLDAEPVSKIDATKRYIDRTNSV